MIESHVNDGQEGLHVRALSHLQHSRKNRGGVASRFQDPPQRRGTGKMRSPIKPVVLASRGFLTKHPGPTRFFIFRPEILEAETLNPERLATCRSSH